MICGQCSLAKCGSAVRLLISRVRQSTSVSFACCKGGIWVNMMSLLNAHKEVLVTDTDCRTCRCSSLPLTPCLSIFLGSGTIMMLIFCLFALRSIRRWNYPRRRLLIGDKTPAYPAAYHTALPLCRRWDRCKLTRLQLQLANRNCTPTIPQSLCSTVHFGFNVFQVEIICMFTFFCKVPIQ